MALVFNVYRLNEQPTSPTNIQAATGKGTNSRTSGTAGDVSEKTTTVIYEHT